MRNNYLGLVFPTFLNPPCNCHPKDRNTLFFFITLSFSVSVCVCRSLWVFGMCEVVGVVVERVGGWYGCLRDGKCCRERERERERERWGWRGKRRWIYADRRRFLSFTIFGAWILLQAFFSLFFYDSRPRNTKKSLQPPLAPHFFLLFFNSSSSPS